MSTRLGLFQFQWFYSPLLSPSLFFSFVIFFTQTVGLLGRVISPSRGRYLHTGQHNHRINAYIDIHALGGFQTHDPSVRASEDSSCLRPSGHCDRRPVPIDIRYTYNIYNGGSLHNNISPPPKKQSRYYCISIFCLSVWGGPESLGIFVSSP
jgi:hypothetical protein